MELQLAFFQILLTFSLFMFMVLKTLKRSKKPNNLVSKLPPSPWKLPIIGNLHQLLGSLPHHTLRNLANKYGPLMHLKIGQVSTMVVSSPEFAKQVMKTYDINFASRPHTIGSKILAYDSSNTSASPYGEYWRQLRKIYLQELLSIKRVQSFQSVREEELFNLIKLIASNIGSSINLTEKIYSSTYSITSRAAFGKKYKDQEKFIEVVKGIIVEAGGFNIADVFPSVTLFSYISWYRLRLEKLRRKADKIMDNIINEHKEARKTRRGKDKIHEDLVDSLLNYHELDGDLEFSLSTNNIKAVILEIFAAGSETSATTVDWAMSEMVKNPRVMKKAKEEVREVYKRKGCVDETSINEMKYLKAVIKETLRLHPPSPLLLPRQCRERCEINGYEIPEMSNIIVNAWAIGRDPQSWSEPEKFYPERFIDSSIDYKGTNFEYIPFGAGRRMCPGISFGLVNVEFPLALFLYHFDWKLPHEVKHEDDFNMSEAFGVSVRRKDDLNLIPFVFHPSSVE